MTHRRGPSSVDVSQKRDIKNKKKERAIKNSLCVGTRTTSFPSLTSQSSSTLFTLYTLGYQGLF